MSNAIRKGKDMTPKTPYRTRDIARAVNQTPQSVRSFLRAKFPDAEGWYSFTADEFQTIVTEMQTTITKRYANRRRAYFLAKKRR